jgi:hypothetical protein
MGCGLRVNVSKDKKYERRKRDRKHSVPFQTLLALVAGVIVTVPYMVVLVIVIRTGEVSEAVLNQSNQTFGTLSTIYISGVLGVLGVSKVEEVRNRKDK